MPVYPGARWQVRVSAFSFFLRGILAPNGLAERRAVAWRVRLEPMVSPFLPKCDPGSQFENISARPSRRRLQVPDPDNSVQAGLHSNPVEFDGIKIGIVEPFPDAEEFIGIAVSEPVSHEVVGALGILVTCDVSDADVVLFLLRQHGDGDPLHIYDGLLAFDHGLNPIFLRCSSTQLLGVRPGHRTEWN
jgi:hypothetical protein